MKLFVTGGHLTPAVATIDEILSRPVHPEIVFVGRETSQEGLVHPAYEKIEMEKRGIRFLPLRTGRLQRFVSVYSLISLLKVPLGFFRAFSLCVSEKPDAVLSFGGYIALPVVVAAAIRGIPVVTHEQTASPGLANRIISRFADVICITFEETKAEFSGKNVRVTGLPVRSDFFAVLKKTREKKQSERKPVIYVTGGSTGSVSLNELMFPRIPDLTRDATVIHQTGAASFSSARKVCETLPSNQKSRYIVREYMDSAEVSEVLRNATLVVGRSGANTTIEIAMLGKIALFIPLPWSAHNEQFANARWLVSKGSAELIEQKLATADLLYGKIVTMIGNKETYQHNASVLAQRIPHDGAKRLADEVMARI